MAKGPILAVRGGLSPSCGSKRSGVPTRTRPPGRCTRRGGRPVAAANAGRATLGGGPLAAAVGGQQEARCATLTVGVGRKGGLIVDGFGAGDRRMAEASLGQGRGAAAAA